MLDLVVAGPIDHAALSLTFRFHVLTVKLNGARMMSGILRGFDPFMNLVIDEGVETTKQGEQHTIGMVVRIALTLTHHRHGGSQRPSLLLYDRTVLAFGIFSIHLCLITDVLFTIVLVESSFWFRFRLFIQFLPL